MEALMERRLSMADGGEFPPDCRENETDSIESKDVVTSADGFVFWKDANGFIRASSKDGDHFVSSAAIEPLERLVNPETGDAWLRIKIISGRKQPREARAPISKGAQGIVRMLQQMGELVRPKLASIYVEAMLAEAWPMLQERDITDEEGDTQDTALLYELFLEFVKDYSQRFDAEEWGWIEEGRDGGKVVVTRPVMAEFFRRAGVPLESQAIVLKNWRERGWLVPGEESGKRRLTRTARVGGVVRRCYVIMLPAEGAAVCGWIEGAEAEEERG